MAPLSESLAAFTEDLRSRWGVPGISVSLLDGRSQGFGNPTSGPMTPDSVALITSNTKLFTSVAIGILVDQGKLTFDSKIKDLIPGFKLANEHTSEHVTIADALSHSTGCASCNMVYAYQYNDSSKDIVDNVCATRCHSELRETYVYDNRWFSVAAYIVEKMSGQVYSAFVQENILQPLGMMRTTFKSKEAELNAVTPSIVLDDDKTVQDLPFFYSKVQPGNGWEGAGGLFSTTADMIKWIGYLMRTVKGENKADDPPIILSSTLKEILRPRNITSMQLWFTGLTRGEAASPEFSAPLYGFAVERYHLYGIDVAAHYGSMAGYASVTLWTPDKDFAIVSLASQVHRGNAVISIVALRAFEEHFGIKHADWEARTISRPPMWTTGPAKPPKMVSYGNPVFDASDLRGTYTAEGYKNLHILGVDDNEGVPAQVLELRNHFLHSKAKHFGRFAGEISTVAIWNSTETYCEDLASLHHVGENVFHGDCLQLYEAHGKAEAILAPGSVMWPISGPLFYAYMDPEGILQLEMKESWEEEVPKNALGEGDITFTRIERF